MEHDAPRWDERYRNAELAVPRMPEAIEDRGDIELLIPSAGRAIDVACGAGAASLWMARRGLDVVALDVSPVAIDLLREAAAQLGLSERIDARVIDLDDGLPPDLVDVDLIVCQRFHDPRLYTEFGDRLHSGAVAIVTVLSVVDADQPGPFHAGADELSMAFTTPRHEILHYDEGGGRASIVVRRR